jgi:hypothetical protein
MSGKEIIDARGADHVLVEGKTIRNVIRNRINEYQGQYKKLLERMNYELATKEDAVLIMVAMSVNDRSLTENTMFFRACVDRAAWLDKEIRALNTIAQTFAEGMSYRITVTDAARFGV